MYKSTTSIWNYNKIDGKLYGDDDGDGDAAVGDDDRCLGLYNQRSGEDGSLLVNSPSGGEVSVTSGVSVCWISDPSARGESI